MNIVITGTTRGLGCDLDAHWAKDHIVRSLSRPGCDITDRESVDATLDAIIAEAGPIDLLVNNAAMTTLGHSMAMRSDVARQMIDTNVYGTWLVSREVAQRMVRAKHGAVVTIGSIHSRQAPVGTTVYAATKAALEAMTSAFAKEYARYGITFNCLNLSPYPTDAMRATGKPEVIEAAIAALPVPRLTTVEEVAGAIMSLVGNPMLTGQTICMAGVR